MRYEILLENQDLVAISKPSGLLTLPDRFDHLMESLRGLLTQRYGEIYTVHRLDRDTSGIVVFARHQDAQRQLARQFEERQVEKVYLAVVTGSMPADAGSYNQPIAEHPTQKGKMIVSSAGKHAFTSYQLIEKIGRYSLLKIHIETGRTHQIRVHLSHAGNPVACDPIYSSGEPILLSSIKKRFKLSKSDEAERPLLNRLALHAWQLNLELPNQEKLMLEAPIPKDMDTCLRQLRKWANR